MRPLKLVMEGFETYCKKTEIDFEKIGTKGIYLISGKTGSGKTSIFDAITFALYGSASGTDRSEKSLRSVNATGDTQTYVELLFENKGKKYLIRRNPTYERKSKKGDGFTTQNAEASLEMPNHEVITRINQVTSKINEIIGLDKNQFTQIAMIAQGAFKELLLAKTDERETIFRKIFKTENFNTLKDRLKSEQTVAKNKMTECKSAISFFINSAECSENSQYVESYKKLKAEKLTLDDTVEVLEKILSEDTAAQEKILTKKINLEQKLSDVAIVIKDALEFQERAATLETTKTEYVKKKSLLAELEKNLAEAKSHESEKSQLQNSIALIENDLPQYESLEKIDAKKNQDKDALNQTEKKLRRNVGKNRCERKNTCGTKR